MRNVFLVLSFIPRIVINCEVRSAALLTRRNTTGDVGLPTAIVHENPQTSLPVCVSTPLHVSRYMLHVLFNAHVQKGPYGHTV